MRMSELLFRDYQIVTMYVVGEDQYKDEDLRCQEVVVFIKVNLGVTIIYEDAEPNE